MAALVLEEVSKAFGGLRALDHVTLRVASGERRALIGPNGAGKTTLFNLISGELAPSAGRIWLFGTEVTRLAAHRRAHLGLGRTFQLATLFPNLSVWQHVLLAVQARQKHRYVFYRPYSAYGAVLARAEALLRAWDMWAGRHVRVRTLSYGEQRRLELLLALAGEPRLLLLDEPTAGLSPAETAAVTAVLQQLDAGLTVVLIEHDMDVAFALADTLTVLHQGRVVAEGRPHEVRKDPRVAEIYLGSQAPC